MATKIADMFPGHRIGFADLETGWKFWKVERPSEFLGGIPDGMIFVPVGYEEVGE